MDDNLRERFDPVGKQEREHIEFRRDYSPIHEPPLQGYPFKDPSIKDASLQHYLTEQQAWEKAQHTAKTRRDECRSKMEIAAGEELTEEQRRQLSRCEENALRDAWLKEWHEAEKAGLEMLRRDRDAAEDQKKAAEAALDDPTQNEEKRKECEREKKQGERRIQETEKTLQSWQQEMAVRKRQKPNGRSAEDLELVGLAFSGGGIRSATFNLGLLQGLAELNLLRFVDYLSTVSGGGYIGGWLAAWCHHGGGLAKVAEQLKTASAQAVSPSLSGDVEPAPLHHLRRHSNYLAPRQGFLSADVWVLWATYLRNFLLNQFVLLPATIAVLLVVRIGMLLYYPQSDTDRPSSNSIVLMIVFTAVTGILWFVTFVVLFWAALKIKPVNSERQSVAKKQLQAMPLLRLTLLLLMGAVLLCSIAPYQLLSPQGWPDLNPWFDCAKFALPCAVLASLAFCLGALFHTNTPKFDWNRAGRAFGAVFFSGLVGGALLYGIYRLLHGRYAWDGMLAIEYVRVRATAEVMTFGPPLVLLALVLAIYAGVGLCKGQMKEGLREWWSSVCARLLAIAGVWLVVNLVALYGTPLVLWAGPWLGTAFGSGWLITVVSGVLAGKGPGTGGRRTPYPYKEWLAWLSPYLFVVGLLIGVSLLLHQFLDCPPRWREADQRVWLRQSQPQRPPSHVVLSRHQKGSDPSFRHERQDTTEHDEMIDDTFIVQQMYWLGILNTEENFVPKLLSYQLTGEDLVWLENQPHFPKEIRRSLQHLVDSKKCFPNQEEFEVELDKLASEQPQGLSYDQRAMIVQHAKNVEWIPCANASARLALKLGLCFLGCSLLLLFALWLVDVNLFSLHALYGNRLIRAYLGASRTVSSPGRQSPRRPDPITGLDPNDDLALSLLSALPFGPAKERHGYDGPFPIINTALNLVHGEELAWQERKAEAFALTPLFCGSATTGYRRTKTQHSAYVSLGNAITLSGAAASPNMGYHSSPAITVLLTVFNARLGAWLGNPRSAKCWDRHGPWFGLWYLFRELFGLTDDRDGFVYLSDGGHFENLGVYELVRRRCRYILVSDAGQDVEHAFEGLANLIRKCRIDFGIRIEIDLNSLQLQGDARRCRWHCAVGKIRYDDVDSRAAPGILIYVKPSLTGDEPADVLHYASAHPAFPHESTGNQFYTESQFESYRALGHHIARTVFEQSVADMNADDVHCAEAPSEARQRRCRALFASMVRRWFAMPPQFETAFAEATHGFIDIQAAFRQNDRLWRLTFDLYPEMEPPPDQLDCLTREENAEQQAERERAELHIVTQMLQIMENAWLSLNLDVHYAHPMNRGWMDVFHRWTSAATLRRHWPILRAELARGFVSFCEKQMRLGIVEGEPIPVREVSITPRQLQRLCLEFTDQWPREPDLEERLQPDQLAWVVFAKNSYPGEEQVRPGAMPCGVIHLTRQDDENSLQIYDFFVWMRGAYRNSGLGRTAVRTVLNDFSRTLDHDFCLRVRLPVGELVGPGGELQRSMWLTFFYNFNFVQISPPGAVVIVLERVFRRQPPPPEAPQSSP